MYLETSLTQTNTPQINTKNNKNGINNLSPEKIKALNETRIKIHHLKNAINKGENDLTIKYSLSESQLKEMHFFHDSQIQQITDQKVIIQDLTSKLNMEIEKNQIIEKSAADLKIEVSHLKNENNSLLATIALLQKEILNEKAEKDQTSIELNSMYSENDNLKKNYQAEKLTLKRKSDNLESEISKLKKIHEASTTADAKKIIQLTKDSIAKEAEILQLKEKNEQYENIHKSVNAQISSIQNLLNK